MKRQLTEEQKAKSAERKERFRKLVKQIADMPEVERAKMTIKIGAVVTCEGRALSVTNTMLCLLQNPTVSMVGGFRQWIKQGRAVIKGQHGIMIWVPVMKHADSNGRKPVELAPTDAPANEADERRFIIGTVFDIGQTQEIETAQNEQVAAPAEEKTIWNDDGKGGPVLICPPPTPKSVSIPAGIKAKTVRIDDEVKSVFLRAKIEGNNLFLTEQLERSLYMRVAKAIEAAGGKWNRKAGCHIFPAPVRESLNINEETVEVLNLKQTFQSFNTPPQLANLVAETAGLIAGDKVLEPSAGDGSLLISAIQHGVFKADICAVEINVKQAAQLQSMAGKVVCGDFMEQNGNLGKFDKVLMNPPFSNGNDVKHILHARQFLSPGGRLVAICANGQRQNESLKPIASTWEELPAGTFKDSGTNVNTVLLTIDA